MPRLPNQTLLYGSKVLNAAYASSGELLKKFIGAPHVQSIIRLVTIPHLPLIINECIQQMDLKVRNVLVPYVRELFQGMPAKSKLTRHDYGTEGGYGYFQLQLKEMIQYPELRSEVFQKFRELGNIIIFMKMLDQGVVNLFPSSQKKQTKKKQHKKTKTKKKKDGNGNNSTCVVITFLGNNSTNKRQSPSQPSTKFSDFRLLKFFGGLFATILTHEGVGSQCSKSRLFL